MIQVYNKEPLYMILILPLKSDDGNDGVADAESPAATI